MDPETEVEGSFILIIIQKNSSIISVFYGWIAAVARSV
jgi:hypothetical protein